MNKIRKVMINDNGIKKVMPYNMFVETYKPNYEPHFNIYIIQGQSGPNDEVWTFPTEGLLYNVKENMYYYIVSQQVLPHTHPAIMPTIDDAFDVIKKKVKVHEGKTTLIWNSNNRQYQKDLGFSDSWTKEEYDLLNKEVEDE